MSFLIRLPSDNLHFSFWFWSNTFTFSLNSRGFPTLGDLVDKLLFFFERVSQLTGAMRYYFTGKTGGKKKCFVLLFLSGFRQTRSFIQPGSAPFPLPYPKTFSDKKRKGRNEKMSYVFIPSFQEYTNKSVWQKARALLDLSCCCVPDCFTLFCLISEKKNGRKHQFFLRMLLLTGTYTYVLDVECSCCCCDVWFFAHVPSIFCSFCRFLQHKTDDSCFRLPCCFAVLPFLRIPYTHVLSFLPKNDDLYIHFQVPGENGGADSPLQRRGWRVRVARNGREEATGGVCAWELFRWARTVNTIVTQSIDLLYAAVRAATTVL